MSSPALNPLRRLWASGRPGLNGWLTIPSVLSAEIMVRSHAWDSVTIDLQHGTADYATMLDLLAVIGQTAAMPMVRVPWNEPAAIMRALDAGALGIICPMVESAAEAEAFVNACLYPPRGNRSFGPVRAKLTHGPDYVAQANDLVLPLVMIETRGAVEALAEILSIEGLGGVYIGPADLGASHGFGPRGDWRGEPKEMVDLITHIRTSAQARGLAACLHSTDPTNAAEKLAEGFNLVTLSSDAAYLENGLKAAVAQVAGVLRR